jgi:hypothetical protein
MRGGVPLPTARDAVLLASLARRSDARLEIGEFWDDGFNTSVAKWALHSRGRISVKGRIAKCPRLQQKRLSS